MDSETELFNQLDLTWVRVSRDKVIHLLPKIKEQDKFLICDRDLFRIVSRGMIGFYQPTEIVA